jgi:sec-independent protein translocase protein TatA
MPSIQHLIVLLVIIMIFFGVGRLPDVLKQMGKGIREFKDASDGVERKGVARSRDDSANDGDDDEEREALEEFKRKRRAAKRIAQDSGRDPRSSVTRSDQAAGADIDGDSDGDNDDSGSAVRSKSRSG